MSASERDAERLEELRVAIAALDAELVDVLARRIATAAEIGRVKGVLGLPVMDPAREAEVVRRAAELARDRGVDPEMVRDVVWRVMHGARGVQGARDAHGARDAQGARDHAGDTSS